MSDGAEEIMDERPLAHDPYPHLSRVGHYACFIRTELASVSPPYRTGVKMADEAAANVIN